MLSETSYFPLLRLQLRVGRVQVLCCLKEQKSRWTAYSFIHVSWGHFIKAKRCRLEDI